MDITTLAELNEALKNSFKAIKDDMSGIKATISLQQSQIQEIAASLTLALQKTDSQLHTLRQESQHHKEEEKTAAWKSYVDTQVETIQSQLIFLRDELETKPQDTRLAQKIDAIQADMRQLRTEKVAQNTNESTIALSQSLSEIQARLQRMEISFQQLRIEKSQEQKKNQLLEVEIKHLKEVSQTIQTHQLAQEANLQKVLTEAQKQMIAQAKILVAEKDTQQQIEIKQMASTCSALTERMKTLDAMLQKMVEFVNKETHHQRDQLSSLQTTTLILPKIETRIERFETSLKQIEAHQKDDVKSQSEHTKREVQEIQELINEITMRITERMVALKENHERWTKTSATKEDIGTLASTIEETEEALLQRLEESASLHMKQQAQQGKEMKATIMEQEKAINAMQRSLQLLTEDLIRLKEYNKLHIESNKKITKVVKNFSELKELSMPEEKKSIMTSMKQILNKGSKKNVGLIAKIGLDEGLITEKDL